MNTQLTVPVNESEWAALARFHKKYGCIDHAYNEREFLPRNLIVILKRLAKVVGDTEEQEFTFEGIKIVRRGSVFCLTKTDGYSFGIDVEEAGKDDKNRRRVTWIKWIFDRIKLMENSNIPNRLRLAVTIYENYSGDCVIPGSRVVNG